MVRTSVERREAHERLATHESGSGRHIHMRAGVRLRSSLLRLPLPSSPMTLPFLPSFLSCDSQPVLLITFPSLFSCDSRHMRRMEDNKSHTFCRERGGV